MKKILPLSLLMLPVLVVAVRRLLARSNTQIHRINQHR